MCSGKTGSPRTTPRRLRGPPTPSMGVLESVFGIKPARPTGNGSNPFNGLAFPARKQSKQVSLKALRPKHIVSDSCYDSSVHNKAVKQQRECLVFSHSSERIDCFKHLFPERKGSSRIKCSDSLAALSWLSGVVYCTIEPNIRRQIPPRELSHLVRVSGNRYRIGDGLGPKAASKLIACFHRHQIGILNVFGSFLDCCRSGNTVMKRVMRILGSNYLV